MWMVHLSCGRSLWRLKSESGTVRYYHRPVFEGRNPPIATCPGCGALLSEAERAGVLIELVENRYPE